MIWLRQLRGDEIRCQEPILRTMMRESPFRFLTPFSAPGRRSHRTRTRFTTENTNTSRLTASLSRMRIHVERAAPQGLCLVCQGVLPFSRFDVVEDLLRVRLSNVDDCQTAEMSIVERRWSQARDGRRFRGDRPFARWSHRGGLSVYHARSLVASGLAGGAASCWATMRLRVPRIRSRDSPVKVNQSWCGTRGRTGLIVRGGDSGCPGSTHDGPPC